MNIITTDLLVSFVTHSPWTDANSSDTPTLSRGQRVLASLRAIFHRSTPEEEAYRRAVRELQGYTDTELAGLGIARCDIKRAVRYGRPGVDTPERDRLAA